VFAGISNIIIGQQQCAMFLIAMPTQYTWFRHFHIHPSEQFYPAGLSSADIRPLHSLLQLQIRRWSQQLVLVPILRQIYPLHTLKPLYLSINFNIYFHLSLLHTCGGSNAENDKWGTPPWQVLTSELSRPAVSMFMVSIVSLFWVPCHYGRVHHCATRRGDALRIWRVVVNIL